PVGGAADRAAHALANALVNNPPDAATLEITFVGPTLQATRPVACALFGAPFQMAIGNRGAVLPGAVFHLQPGEVLKIAGTPSGARAYLAIRGGIDAPLRLGSRSSFEPLVAGATLPGPGGRGPRRSLSFVRLVPAEWGRLRVLPGPQAEWFLNPNALSAETYEVSPQANRMGLRLRGATLERRPGELMSEAVAPGVVQVTNDGQPVILGIDGQTIGGYPKIAHVIEADLDQLGQLKAGDRVRFVPVKADEAAAAEQQAQATLGEWRTRLAVTAVV
ncbi:MAG: biotin-dependent carboxyltransferase family protein, partial [Gemmataceae bacterium]